MFPCAEHRFCIRHIHENMKQCWRGKQYKDLLWRCAAATTTQELKRAMDQLKAVSDEAFAWLNQIPLKHWSRAHFTGMDIVVYIMDTYVLIKFQ